jgi:methylenetetrahydrofolate dehydrogenase (NADP+)/methenyltetrahydrofolate cyclohydrolase
MALDMTNLFPATFRNFELLERYGVETKGKHTVVIGRSHCGSPNEYFDG